MLNKKQWLCGRDFRDPVLVDVINDKIYMPDTMILLDLSNKEYHLQPYIEPALFARKLALRDKQIEKLEREVEYNYSPSYMRKLFNDIIKESSNEGKQYSIDELAPILVQYSEFTSEVFYDKDLKEQLKELQTEKQLDYCTAEAVLFINHLNKK